MSRIDHVLITGGAGFIGSHVADRLLERGIKVRALDSLLPQVHGHEAERPRYLSRDVELIVGDVRDRGALSKALRGVDAVIHLAAAVGVGQSMYRVEDYVSTNAIGTSVLLEELARAPVGKLVVASSMSVYGEGLYRDERGRLIHDASRTLTQLKEGRWDPEGPAGERLVPIATSENKQLSLESVYALSKYDQERLCLLLGRAYEIPTVALRFFNVYGPRQALSNPYTGVLAIFASRLLNAKAPIIYEDGLQRRDFVSVHDAAKAVALALFSKQAEGRVFNIGSGAARTVKEVAESIAKAMGRERLAPRLTAQYRVGDVRHCFADISAARETLSYEPAVDFDRGLVELVSWLEGQVARDGFDQARAELQSRGLTL